MGASNEGAAVLLAVAVATLVWAAPASSQEVQQIHRAEGADAWSLQLEEVLAIGSMDGDESFGRIMDIAWDSRGRFLVADDHGGSHVKVFGSDGSYVRTIGREGEGPGEFTQPWGVAVDASDSLYVWDAARSLISVFSPDHQFSRSFRVPPWLVNSMEVPAPDRIVLAAFGTGETLPIKVLDKEGALLLEAGRAIDLSDNLAGYEGSVLGGSLTQTEDGYAYTNKSPRAVTWFDRDLRPMRTCVGPSDWTTDPGDVVYQNDRGAGLRWNRFVYSASIVGMPGAMALNAIRDPVADLRVLHLVTRECVIKSEIRLEGAVSLTRSKGDLVAAIRNLDYPEVVLYRVTTTGRSQD